MLQVHYRKALVSSALMSMSVVALICHFRNETLATEFVKAQDRLDKLKLLQTQAFRFLFLFKKKNRAQ